MLNPVLRIQFLGGFKIDYGDLPVFGVNSLRAQSLLAYLVLHADTPQPRQHLAFLLWPDTTESQARNNLRQFIYLLRHALPDANRFLAADTSTVYWKIDESQDIDLQSFECSLREIAAAEQQHKDPKIVQPLLEQAIAFYQGDLLPGCYDDWIVPDRERLRQGYFVACQKLVRVLESQREYEAALQINQRLLRLDPLDENTYVSLMRLHSLNNNHTGARQTYQIAVETLKRELGVEPGEALRAAYKRLEHPAQLVSSVSADQASANSYRLVGRQVEWRGLQAAWQHAANGNSHFTLITGEAGIGKSRLAEELFIWVNKQGFTAARARCYAAEGRLSLAPAMEWLRSPALRSHLTTLSKIWLAEVGRLLPELLTDYPDLPRPEPINEYGQRQHFFEALVRAVLTAPRPTLLWIDDLHWCDPVSLEWLHFLLRYQPNSSLLVLGTARSEESPPDHPLVALARQLRSENKLNSIDLVPLDAAETIKLASQVAERDLDVAEAMSLFRQTEGNPLFVVETVRARMGNEPEIEVLSSSHQEDDKENVLPPRVYSVIAGRLARLSPAARKVTEIGAAIGREFTLDVLLQVGQGGEAATTNALDELWQKRILHEQIANVLDFTHDKLREVAYAETSLPHRRMLHRRIAQALEALNVNNLDAVSAQIAAQYESAGLFEQALPYFQRASSVAAKLYANDEAIALLRHALALLSHFPAGTKRDSQELPLQLALSWLFSITQGWTSPDVEQCLNRAQILSDRVGDLEQKAHTLQGLEILYAVQARLDRVRDMHPEVHQLFVKTQGSLPPKAALMYASTSFHMGHLLEARQQFESIVAIRDDLYSQNLLTSQGLNHVVHGQIYLSHILWCLGYPRLALNNANTAIEFARKNELPFDRAKAVTYLALLHEWCAGFDAFCKNAGDAYSLTSTYKAPYYHTWAGILLSFARALQQPDADNLTRLRDSIHTFIETGAHLRLPVYFSLLARAYLKAGLFDEGLAALEQAFAESSNNKEVWWDAELHRLRGELMGAKGENPDDVEVTFQRALDIATAQQAKSLELRAATSLARFWQTNSRFVEARQLLTRVFDWFTEGFDTPDLVTAQALIARL